MHERSRSLSPVAERSIAALLFQCVPNALPLEAASDVRPAREVRRRAGRGATRRLPRRRSSCPSTCTRREEARVLCLSRRSYSHVACVEHAGQRVLLALSLPRLSSQLFETRWVDRQRADRGRERAGSLGGTRTALSPSFVTSRLLPIDVVTTASGGHRLEKRDGAPPRETENDQIRSREQVTTSSDAPASRRCFGPRSATSLDSSCLRGPSPENDLARGTSARRSGRRMRYSSPSLCKPSRRST
jgi:hypothetical protein